MLTWAMKPITLLLRATVEPIGRLSVITITQLGRNTERKHYIYKR